MAGGTLPEFGAEGALRPPRERGDDDIDDDGIPNEWDAVDNEHPDDDDGPEAIQWDGRDPEDRTGRATAPMTEATEARSNPSTEFLYANKWRIFGVMMIGWAMSLLDISIVNITIPELEHEIRPTLRRSRGSSTPTTSPSRSCSCRWAGWRTSSAASASSSSA